MKIMKLRQNAVKNPRQNAMEYGLQAKRNGGLEQNAMMLKQNAMMNEILPEYREIVLRRADYNEYKISEKDFKSLHPNDFEDLNILHIQGKLDHLPKQDKVNLHNADASDFPFKEDYTIVYKPRAVINRDRDDNRKMMRIDEVHKCSDGTLTRIKEKLDFMVKDFKLFKFNKSKENRKWTKDNKRRREDFIEVIERRLKIRRIF
ncbi:hypothetical protein Tco_0796609 [Tanacetum coccineum]